MGIAQLDTLVLSHGDSDHIGGTESILRGLPVVNVISSLPNTHPMLQLAAHNDACADGQSWEWDGVHFDMLHPDKSTAIEAVEHNNERSCVLRVSTGERSILLTGDIEKLAELRLLQLHTRDLPATLLVAAHHGSLSSSSQAFVNAVHPRYVVFTSGYLNRFGHPKEEVVERFRAAGSELLRSDEDGAVSIAMNGQEFTVDRYRKSHARYWQHDATSSLAAQ
jgi:competence protein ComEC